MKKSALLLLKVVFSVGILVYIFTRVVHISDLWANLREASISYLLAAVAVYLVVQTLSAYRWYLILKPLGIETGFPKILALYYLGMYFNFFLPSAIGGDVFKVYYLHKETGRLSASTATVFLDRDVGMGGLLVAATLVAAYGGTRFPPDNGFLLAPLFALIGVAFIAANLALFYRPSYNLLHRLLRLFRMKRADERVERLFESVNSYRGEWGLAAVTLVISLGVQFGCAFVNILAASSIGLHTQHGWIDYMVFIPAIGLIGMIPLSVNGAGWREASYILLFQSVAIGVDAQQATHQAATLSVLWLGIVIITSLPGGIIYLLRGGRARESGGPGSGADGETRIIGAPLEPSREEEPISTI
ncbi:MAG TPA: lysylphosphatidylglycerol synthase transmembrane domain-containing protein [Blastocatellia bacterium]|nr:lysylphosphatidylglycerol synthase transmembrane domain-containing protein [Blastocatellia bacterium]